MDRTAIITGGTGGLGRAVVGVFAANDWRVVVLDARPADLAGAEVVEADLTDAAAVARAVARATGDAGAPLRAVVNLVGGFAAGQPVATTPVEDFEAQFSLNLRRPTSSPRRRCPRWSRPAAARSSACPRAPRCTRSRAPRATAPRRPR